MATTDLFFAEASLFVLGALAILCVAATRTVSRQLVVDELPGVITVETEYRAPGANLILTAIVLIAFVWWLICALTVGVEFAAFFGGSAVPLVGAYLRVTRR